MNKNLTAIEKVADYLGTEADELLVGYLFAGLDMLRIGGESKGFDLHYAAQAGHEVILEELPSGGFEAYVVLDDESGDYVYAIYGAEVDRSDIEPA